MQVSCSADSKLVYSRFVLTKMRLWTLARWVITLGLVVVVTMLAVVVTQVIRDRSWLDAAKTGAPIGAALVALLSLIATSISLAANWRRQRRHETLKAWTDWSDTCYPARVNVTKVFGMPAIPTNVGLALANDESWLEGDIDISDKPVRQKVGRDLVLILNGLERIAIGTQMGVYDVTTLRKLGGTTIVREFERGESYIAGRRAAKDALRRQVKAYVALESLANELKAHRLREEKSDLDRKRLSSLRRSR